MLQPTLPEMIRMHKSYRTVPSVQHVPGVQTMRWLAHTILPLTDTGIAQCSERVRSRTFLPSSYSCPWMFMQPSKESPPIGLVHVSGQSSVACFEKVDLPESTVPSLTANHRCFFQISFGALALSQAGTAVLQQLSGSRCPACDRVTSSFAFLCVCFSFHAVCM